MIPLDTDTTEAIEFSLSSIRAKLDLIETWGIQTMVARTCMRGIIAEAKLIEDYLSA